MTLRTDFESLAAQLPFSLRQEILGYVQAVDDSSEEIFRDAHVGRSPELLDRLLFIAGVRRLHSLTTSYYWLLDRSLELLGSDASAVAVGRSRLRRGEGDMKRLGGLVAHFDSMLSEHRAGALVRTGSFADVVQLLARAE